MSKAIGHIWFCGRSNVGIVMGYDEITQKVKAWISSIPGTNEDDDIQWIMDWGSKFPTAEAYSLILKRGTITDLTTWIAIKKGFGFGSVDDEVDNSNTKGKSS